MNEQTLIPSAKKPIIFREDITEQKTSPRLGVNPDGEGALHSGEVGLDLAPVGEGSVLGEVLDVHAVLDEPATLPHAVVLVAVPLGEAPLLRDVDLEW